MSQGDTVRREADGYVLPLRSGPIEGHVKVYDSGPVELRIMNYAIDLGPHQWARIVRFVADPPAPALPGGCS